MDELDKAVNNLKKQLRKLSKEDIKNLHLNIPEKWLTSAIAEIYDEKFPIMDEE